MELPTDAREGPHAMRATVSPEKKGASQVQDLRLPMHTPSNVGLRLAKEGVTGVSSKIVCVDEGGHESSPLEDARLGGAPVLQAGSSTGGLHAAHPRSRLA